MPNPLENVTGPHLIKLLVAGDVEAFKTVYRRYFQKVLHFVYRFSLDKEDAEEVVQDVFVKLWNKRTTLDAEKNLDVFLYVVAKNLVIDRIRKYVATKKHLHLLYHTSQNGSLQNATEQLVNFYELKETLDRLIDTLPARRRMIFKLNREKGLSYKEIADVLNISQGTVEKQMSRAIHSLKDKLASQYYIHVDLLLLITLLFSI